MDEFDSKLIIFGASNISNLKLFSGANANKIEMMNKDRFLVET